MAKTTEKTVILDFEVDLDDGVKSIERLRNENKLLTQERNRLNTATKEGRMRIAELNTAIDKNTATIKANSSSLEKQRLNVGNYTSSIKDAAKEINIAGTNVGQLSSKLISFANPATLAAGAVTALAGAYASSTVGARDLAFASDQLSFVTGKLSEDLGRLVGGEDGGGGKGLLSQLTNKYLELVQFVPLIKGLDLVTGNAVSEYIESLRKGADDAAKALEKLRDIEISLAFAKGFFKEDERSIENQRRNRDDEEKSLEARLASAQKINDLFESAEIRSTSIIRAQIDAIKESTIGYDNNREAQLSVAKLESEILDLQEMVNGKLTENLKVRQQLLAIAESEAGIARINAAISPEDQLKATAQDPIIRQRVTAQDSDAIVTGRGTEVVIDMAKTLEKAKVQITQDGLSQRAESERRYTEFIAAEEQARLNATMGFFAALSGIFQEGSEAQKALAILQIAIDSGVGVANAVAAGSGVPFPGNLVAILTGVTAVLTGIGQAKQLLGFADGGWTGPGDKHKPVGVVHADEYVVPKHIVHNPAYSGHISALERGRLMGYADGGLVANNIKSPVDQQLIIANAMKKMPVPVLPIVEFRKKEKALIMKERYSQR